MADGNVILCPTSTARRRPGWCGCHTEGDNSQVVATDTQKNTVYAFAEEHGIGSATYEEIRATLRRGRGVRRLRDRLLVPTPPVKEYVG